MKPDSWPWFFSGLSLLIGALGAVGCVKVMQGNDKEDERSSAVKPTRIERYGSVIGLRPEKKDRYNELHAKAWPEINAMIKKCNIQNYSIYETELDGKLYLFSYFEYVGDDFQADMARMAADPKTQEWWKECVPCQIRLPDTPEGEHWKTIPEVYHLD